MTVRTRKPALRKPPARWRRYLTQAELDLPPADSALPSQNGIAQDFEDPDVGEAEPIEWWQTRPVIIGVAVIAFFLLVLAIVALRASSHARADAEGIQEGQWIARGQIVGYVGTSGNAPPNTPHLHLAFFRLGPEKQWWKGTPINPYPLLARAAEE